MSTHTMSSRELRALRENQGLTQAQAARACGYSLRHYCRMEAGATPIPKRWASVIRGRLRLRAKKSALAP